MVATNDEEFQTILDYELKAKGNNEDVRIIGTLDCPKPNRKRKTGSNGRNKEPISIQSAKNF